MIVTDEIVRDETTHTYWQVKPKNLGRVVGYSELIRELGYQSGFGSPEAMRRGRNVHLALHFYAKGKMGIGKGLKSESLRPHLRPYFDSAVRFLEERKAKFLYSEAFVFDPVYRLACQLDAVVEINGIPTILEYKTGQVLECVKYQTAAAVNGLPELPGGKMYQRWALQLSAEEGGQAILTTFKDPSDMTAIRMFAASFYRRVADGALMRDGKRWAQSWDGFEKQRRQEYGIDLFTGDTNETTNGNGEAKVGAASEPGVTPAASNG